MQWCARAPFVLVLLVVVCDCVGLAGSSGCAGQRPRPADRTRVEPTVLSAAQAARDAALAPRLRPFFEAHSNYDGVLSPDGTQLLYCSNRGGISEIYLAEVAHPERPARKLVSGPERVTSPVFLADGKTVLYRRDRGLDENFHLWRIGSDGSGAVDLTPGGPLWRDAPLLPRERPRLVVYSARKTDDYASMIIVHPLDPGDGQPRVVYRDPGAGSAIDVSADGGRALWLRETTSGGHELAEIDLTSGRERRISPADGRPAEVSAAAYASDGKRVYVGTDGGGETHVLLALDLATLAPLAEYRQERPASAEVGSIVPSPRGDRVAITVDAGNHATVRVLDARTLAVVADVATPLGVASVGNGTEARTTLGTGVFSADGRRFLLGVSTAERPHELYLADAHSGAYQPLRREARPGLDELPAVDVAIETVRAHDGLALPVNVYLPRDRAPGQRLPTLVYFHGGPDGNTAVSWDGGTRALTALGFAVLEPNIRGSTGFGRAYAHADDGAKRLDALADIATVNAWARRQPWCDPERLVIEGASFGGYLVLMALTRQPRLWRAGIDVAGPSDLTAMLAGGAIPARYRAELGDPVADAALIRALSPIHQVDRIEAPLFVYQGQNDAHVPRAHADAIVGALRARHIPVEYMMPANEGHTIAHRENGIELLARELRFLEDQGIRGSVASGR
jgi:dipeptidyl aminopeptidase/acylaminoacyl peptidase